MLKTHSDVNSWPSHFTTHIEFGKYKKLLFPPYKKILFFVLPPLVIQSGGSNFQCSASLHFGSSPVILEVLKRSSLCIRQHVSAYVSSQRVYLVYQSLNYQCMRRLKSLPLPESEHKCIRQYTSEYVSIRPHTSAYVSIRQHTSAYVSIRQHTPGGNLESADWYRPMCSCIIGTTCARENNHTSAYVSIRQHTSAYVSIRQLTSTYVSCAREGNRILTCADVCWRVVALTSTADVCWRMLTYADVCW
jgi:hypothetical protein